MNRFTHFDEKGAARMVDIGDKPATRRRAVAEGFISMRPETMELILKGEAEKGDVFGVARIAGIMAAKKTSELIPLCHPLPLTQISIRFEPIERRSEIRCLATVETVAPTGVEMEALTAVQIALLTLYDMCKAVDRAMTIRSVRLLEKRGGKSGLWRHPGESSSRGWPTKDS